MKSIGTAVHSYNCLCVPWLDSGFQAILVGAGGGSWIESVAYGVGNPKRFGAVDPIYMQLSRM